MTKFGMLLALLATPLLAQTTAWKDPGPAAIDSIFAQYDRTSGPGCALGVFGGGGTLYRRGYGMADLNQGIAIRPATVFYIASTSKQFTAASIALAAEQGKVDLDAPISRYLPELPSYTARVTVRHLIEHTSGIRDYLGLWGMSGRSFADEIPEDVAYDLIGRQLALDFEPGTRWSYSNSGYFLLGVIIKRATGLTLAQFAARYLFEPLGMTDTHFHDDNRAIVPRRAEGYQPKGDGFEIVRTSFAAVGDGGLYTTVDDLAKWDANFAANRLGNRGQALIDQLTTPGRLASGASHGYAFGLMAKTYRGQPIIEHGGSFIGYRAQLLRFPALRFSVAILCNDYTAAPEQLAQRVADRYLAGVLETAAAPSQAAAVEVSGAVLARYEGRYEVMPGQVVVVSREGGDLKLAAFGQTVRLVPQSDSVFTAALLPGRVVFRTVAGTMNLAVEGLGTDPAPQLGPQPALSAAELHAYAGRFVSDELDSWANVSVVDSALWIRARYDQWTVMQPVSPGVFAARGGRIAFTRDRRGQVNGFRLSAGRAANIEFVRAVRPLRWSPLDRPGLTATGSPR